MFITENKDLDFSNLRLEGKGLFKRILPICLQIKYRNCEKSPNIITQNSFSHQIFFFNENSCYINTNLLLPSIKEEFNLEPNTIFQLYQFNKEKEIFNLKEITYQDEEQFEKEIFSVFKDIELQTLNKTFKSEEGFYNYFSSTFEAYIFIKEEKFYCEMENLDIEVKSKIDIDKALHFLSLLVKHIFSNNKDLKFKTIEEFFYFSFCLDFLKHLRITDNISIDLNDNNISIHNIESLRKKINVI